MGRSLNAAIGLQIVIGALITGLAAVTTGRNVRRSAFTQPSVADSPLTRWRCLQTSIMTSILGTSVLRFAVSALPPR